MKALVPILAGTCLLAACGKSEQPPAPASRAAAPQAPASTAPAPTAQTMTGRYVDVRAPGWREVRKLATAWEWALKFTLVNKRKERYNVIWEFHLLDKDGYVLATASAGMGTSLGPEEVYAVTETGVIEERLLKQVTHSKISLSVIKANQPVGGTVEEFDTPPLPK